MEEPEEKVREREGSGRGEDGGREGRSIPRMKILATAWTWITLLFCRCCMKRESIDKH